MKLFVNDIVQKITDGNFSGEKFKITNIKTLSGNLHAVLTSLDDENSEITVALSVLEDKNRFKIIKKI